MDEKALRELTRTLVQSDHRDNVPPLSEVALERFIPFLSEEEEMRAGAAYAVNCLMRFDKYDAMPVPVLEALADQLVKESSQWVREHIIYALNGIDNASSITALVTCFVHNEDYEALYALQRIKSDIAKPLLESYLKSTNTAYCFLAAYALASIYYQEIAEDTLMKWIVDKTPHHALPAIFAIETYKSEENIMFLKNLYHASQSQCMRAASMHVLHLITDTNEISMFRDALTDSDVKVRQEATWALQYRAKVSKIEKNSEDHADLINALLIALNDEDAMVRAFAVDALRGGINFSNVFMRLCNMLDDEASPVRKNALYAVYDYKNEEAKAKIVEFIGNNPDDADNLEIAKSLLNSLSR